MDYEEVPLVRPPQDSTPIPSPVAAEPLIDTDEPLPNVVIGSEPWHRGLSAVSDMYHTIDLIMCPMMRII